MLNVRPASFRVVFTTGHVNLCCDCHALLFSAGSIPAPAGEDPITLDGFKHDKPAPTGAECDGCASDPMYAAA